MVHLEQETFETVDFLAADMAMDALTDLDFDFFADVYNVIKDDIDDENAHNGRRQSVVKSGFNKCGRKMSKNKTSTPKPFRKGMTVAQAITAQGQMPNMSRRTPSRTLVAFPVFDKCDSLVYFPHSYVRHLNSGDIESTAKLIFSHSDKDCQVRYTCGSESCAFSFTLEYLMDFLRIGEELEPDRIMCVHSTKVIENQIRSVVYMKLTDSQTLYSSVCSIENVPELQPYMKRADRFQVYAVQSELSESVRQDVMHCSQTEDDMLIYMRMELVLTFDDRNRKIKVIETDYRLTSIHPVHIAPGTLVG